MLGTLIGVLLVLSVGTRATDAVRLRQQEVVLRKLPVGEAAAFYEVLRRRIWKIRFLRLVALLSVLVIISARGRLRARHPAPPPGATPAATEPAPRR
jgi:hypothetical protein